MEANLAALAEQHAELDALLSRSTTRDGCGPRGARGGPSPTSCSTWRRRTRWRSVARRTASPSSSPASPRAPAAGRCRRRCRRDGGPGARAASRRAAGGGGPAGRTARGARRRRPAPARGLGRGATLGSDARHDAARRVLDPHRRRRRGGRRDPGAERPLGAHRSPRLAHAPLRVRSRRPGARRSGGVRSPGPERRAVASRARRRAGHRHRGTPGTNCAWWRPGGGLPTRRPCTAPGPMSTRSSSWFARTLRDTRGDLAFGDGPQGLPRARGRSRLRGRPAVPTGGAAPPGSAGRDRPAAAVALLAACGDDDDAASTTAAVTTPTTAASTTTASTPGGDEQASSPPSSASASSTGEEIQFSGPNGELIGVLAEADSPQGAVLVIHENRGLTPHIRSIPPRLAADGYTALAIDLLSAEGGTASCRPRVTPPPPSATHPRSG